MRVSVWFLSLSALVLPLAGHARSEPADAGSSAVPSYVTAAMHDPARQSHKVDKAVRMSPHQLATVLTFTGIEPGDTVIEIEPGSGYWTRLFSRMVGSDGHVYTVWPKQSMKYARKNLQKWKKLSAGSHYANVTELVQDAQTLTAPTKADVVFTSDNYHDYHNMDISVAGFDKSVYRALKPGGLFIVIDHRAPANSGTRDTDTLHRIDPVAVKKEMKAAGFVFAGASNVLLNSDDPLDVPVFDKSIRGHTSQFVLRFRRPGKGNGEQGRRNRE